MTIKLANNFCCLEWDFDKDALDFDDIHDIYVEFCAATTLSDEKKVEKKDKREVKELKPTPATPNQLAIINKYRDDPITDISKADADKMIKDMMSKKG